MKVELHDNALFKHVSRKIFQSDILKRDPKKINSRIAVFSKGQTISSLYLVIEGSVNIIDYNFMNRRKDENKSKVIEPGNFFGHDEIFTAIKRTSAAITLNDCEIYELTIDELNFLIAQDEQIKKNLTPEPHKTNPDLKIKTTNKNESYFDFRARVDHDDEKQALISDTENGSGKSEVQLKELRIREEELLERLNELEKINEREEVEAKEKEPDPDHTINLERDYNLAFQVQEYEDVAVVFVNIQRGVAASALPFKLTLDKLLTDGKMKIVVDLSFCEFLDSAFLGVLVTLMKDLNTIGGSLSVVLNAIKISSSTFFLSGMDRVFKVQTDLTKAIRELVGEDR